MENDNRNNISAIAANAPTKQRESGLELYRIITMLLIVAHHFAYGIPALYTGINDGNANLFMLIYGMWGKTGINCFVLITGYFMCKSEITLRKLLKLLVTVLFWNIVIYAFFILTGYEDPDIKDFVFVFLPVKSVTQGFVSCYLLFFLTIPFLNILIRNLNKQQHLLLMTLCLFIYTIMGSIGFMVSMNYVSWFVVLYFVGSYLRLYPQIWFGNKKLWLWLTVASILFAIASVIVMNHLQPWKIFKAFDRIPLPMHFFVSDSNKIGALLVAVTSFMLFKSFNIRYSKFINTVASATFGVLIIHANSDTMRHWLWEDTLNIPCVYEQFIRGRVELLSLMAYSVLSVLAVYAVCTILELLRLKFTEKPILDWLESFLLKIYRKNKCPQTGS